MSRGSWCDMKPFQMFLGGLGVGLAGLGALMAATNPPEAAFEEFAVGKLKTDGCKEVPSMLRQQCPEFVEDNQAELKKLITQSSDRQNYFLFSIYSTNLSARSLFPGVPFFIKVPSFRLETVGMFGKFYIYDANKQE
ncbi:DUF4359 domain-containing protein [Myxacorys almedinensis]|uniref:DUF4359 domain-containing protein n=1 Tax=Myxacorys almedinensis A TaxID=2690445 RepID=A0A8J8CPM8_9CYAN|nr:DUF4359 domain-containing protein [Myxacorys almedinensis]NDJ19697.1 DUF4359 domain-containing protein [Myxacorys almedinensis A]